MGAARCWLFAAATRYVGVTPMRPMSPTIFLLMLTITPQTPTIEAVRMTGSVERRYVRALRYADTG